MSVPSASLLDPRRTVRELRELQMLTGDSRGAQRVAFTRPWAEAREWLRAKVDDLPVTWEMDEALNVWITLRGRAQRELILGSHLDSVPDGGWLDGCLGVLAGLEVLRRLARQGTPPVTVRLVDWTDEEGARFGRSLFGSSASCGTLDVEDVRYLRDAQGTSFGDVASEYGIDLDHLGAAASAPPNAAAYLELHIEQGPVLESMGLPLGAVLGTVGIERHVVRFMGQTAHAGSTPMFARRDGFSAAARLALEARSVAARHKGVTTIGSCLLKPGIPTAVPGECEITIDQRHLDRSALAAMLSETRKASVDLAREEGVGVDWSRLWSIEPLSFHPDLVELADRAITKVAGTSHRLPSGPLHDAAEMSRRGVPTAMMFVQSLRGLSHAREEDTREEHLELAVLAFDRLVTQTMSWIVSGGGR